MRIPTTDHAVQSRPIWWYTMLPLLFVSPASFYELLLPDRPIAFEVTIQGEVFCLDGMEEIPPSPLAHVYVVKNQQITETDPILKLEEAALKEQLYYEPTTTEGTYKLKFRAVEGEISTLIYDHPGHERKLVYVRPTVDKEVRNIKRVVLLPKSDYVDRD